MSEEHHELQLTDPNHESREPEQTGSPAATCNSSPVMESGRLPALAELSYTPGLPPPQKPGVASAVNLRSVLAAFRRRWFVVFAVGSVFSGIVGALTWTLVPTAPYTSFAEIRIKSVAERMLFKTAETDAKFNTYKQTQMRQIKSPFVLTAAIRKPEISKLSTLRDEPYPIEWLEANVNVSSPATEFIRISLSGKYPKDLHKIVSAIAESYLNEVVYADHEKRSDRMISLERINRDIEDRLRGKRTGLRQLAETLQTSDSHTLTLKQQLAHEFYRQLQQEYTRIRFELMRAEVKLASFNSKSPGPLDVGIRDSVIEMRIREQPEIARLNEEISKCKRLLEMTRQVVSGDENALLVNYRERLTGLEDDLVQASESLRPILATELEKIALNESTSDIAQLEETVKMLTSQQEALKTDLESQRVETKRIGVSSFELESLREEIRQVSSLGERVEDEIQKLQIEIQSPIRVSMHREAKVANEPDLSGQIRMTAMAGLGVFGLLATGIVLLEIHAYRISSAQDVVEGLGLKIIGSLPLMPGWMTSGKQPSHIRPGGKRDLMRSMWKESVDSTRTMILSDPGVQEKCSIILVASATSGEGKTTLCSHLAVSLARTGRRTLLIDMDLRRANVARIFDIDRTPGVCEILKGEAETNEAIQSTSSEGLFILPAGKINQIALNALAADGSKELFTEVREQFDIVIVDSAPLLGINDSLLIASYVDGALLAVRRDISQMGKVAAARERLSMLGIPVVGAVTTGIDATGDYKYGYGYGYGSSYFMQPELLKRG